PHPLRQKPPSQGPPPNGPSGPRISPQPGRTLIGLLCEEPMPLLEIPELTEYSPRALDSFFSAILTQFDQEAAAANTADAVEQLRIRWIGRKQGLLTRVGEVLKGAPPETRRDVGMRFNALKSAIEPRCDPEQVKTSGPIADAIDITLPGTRRRLG